MILKKISNSILLCSASALLAGMTALAKLKPGGGGSQPNMPSQPTSPGMGAAGHGFECRESASGSRSSFCKESSGRRAPLKYS